VNNRKHLAFYRRWRPLLLLIAAAGVSWWIYRTGPVTRPEEEDRPAKIVKTVAVQPSTERIQVTAYGSVIPARRVVIEPQVSGHVIRLHQALVPGGYVQKDTELYAIDSKLIELELQENQAELERAEAQLKEDRRKLDEGQRLAFGALIPATELAALESTVSVQEAELERLNARLARSQELLKRHVVRSPFNAIVLEEAVEIGQRVSPGDATVTLVGTDEFWVQTSLPTDQLQCVRLPSTDRPGASATVFLDSENVQSAPFSGEVIQRLGDLTEAGRMARILIRIKDPLQLSETGQNPPLLLGSYVRVDIDAGELRNVLVLDRAALRENDRIWIVDGQNRLHIRKVDVRWRKDETVYVNNVLQPGEVVVVSQLRVALPGMEVRPQQVTESAIGSGASTAGSP